GQQERFGLLAGGAATGRIDYRHPEAVHRKEIVTLAHVGMREHRRFLLEVDPGCRIERVSVWRRHTAVVGRRIALDVDECSHRPTQRLDLVNVGHLYPGHLGRDQRVAVNVGVHGDRLRLVRRQRLNAGWHDEADQRSCYANPTQDGVLYRSHNDLKSLGTVTRPATYKRGVCDAFVTPVVL